MDLLGMKLKRIFLVIGDLIIFQLALALTLWLRYGDIDRITWDLHFLPFSVLSLLWLIGSYVTGLYDLSALKNGIKFFRLFLEGMIANLAIALAYFYLIPIFNIAPRTNLFLYFAIVLLLGYIWRLAYNRFLNHRLFKNKVLFVGPGTDAMRIYNLLQKPGYGFELSAVVETVPGARFAEDTISWHMSTDSIRDILNRQHVHTILLGHKPDEVPGLKDALYQTLFTSTTLLDQATFEEAMTGCMPLEYVSQTWFLEHLRENDKTWYESFKRLTDLVLAIPIGLVTLVLYPLIALTIKFSTPGPVLYSQIRIGKMGQSFRIWKFRSMIQDAEADGRPQFASPDDHRITPVGKFLRVTRLDELPQIWNVLRGDMSLIGPRPERPEFVEELTRQMSFYALRHLARPGLTGWAQVKFPYAGTFADNLTKLQFDLYYIKHRSFLIDVAILLKTVGIVLRRQGT
jgi:exopolysaccharide biosynthesis polyprenyl glycosylphosphotransferase